MTPETITVNELFSIGMRIEIRAKQLIQLGRDADHGDLSPETATAQANTILKKIEFIAWEAQRP